MQRTTEFHDEITDTRISGTTGAVDLTAPRDTAVDVLDTHTSACDTPIHGVRLAHQSTAMWLAGGVITET